MAEEKKLNGADNEAETTATAPQRTDDETPSAGQADAEAADRVNEAEEGVADEAETAGTTGEETASEADEAEADLPLRPAWSQSRTTNIPPLMPAGYTRSRQPQKAEGGKARKTARKPKKATEAATAEAHIGPLRTQSSEPRTDGKRPRQRRMKVHSDGGSRRFVRRHWWWMVLLALLVVIGVSLPWTLPVMREWEGTDDADSLTIDTPKVAPRPVVAVPDTTGAAARADSLRQDSIRRAAAHAYWVRQQALKKAEAEAEDQGDGDAPAAAPAEHADSVHR